MNKNEAITALLVVIKGHEAMRNNARAKRSLRVAEKREALEYHGRQIACLRYALEAVRAYKPKHEKGEK